jgi:hypothetical protein
LLRTFHEHRPPVHAAPVHSPAHSNVITS